MRYLATALMLALLVLGCRVDDRKSSGATPIEQGEDVRACFYPDNLEAINDCPAEKRMVQFTLIEVEGVRHRVKFDHVFTGAQIQLTTYLDEQPYSAQVCTQLAPADIGRRTTKDEQNSCQTTWEAGPGI